MQVSVPLACAGQVAVSTDMFADIRQEGGCCVEQDYGRLLLILVALGEPILIGRKAVPHTYCSVPLAT